MNENLFLHKKLVINAVAEDGIKIAKFILCDMISIDNILSKTSKKSRFWIIYDP